MKWMLPLLTIVTLISCRKTNVVETRTDSFLNNVKDALADSMGVAIAELDFSKAKLSVVMDSVYFLQLPFRSKCLIVKTDSKGNNVQGRIVQLQQSSSLNNARAYQGQIMVQSLNQLVIKDARVVDGHVRDKRSLDEEYVTPDPYVELPEVIIVSTYQSGGYDYSVWLSMLSLFYDGDGYGGYYSPYYSDGQTTSGGGGGGGSTYDDGITPAPTIYVDYEDQFDNPSIDVEGYLRCFSSIADDGAECSIELFTDLPVNGDPTKLFDFNNGSPGHVFIQLKKSKGSQLVVQNFGFYPRQGWKAATNSSAVAAKVVDNGYHEFNASIHTKLTPAQLKTAISALRNLASSQYDIDQYNCTDFALQIYNNTQPLASRINIPLLQIPNGVARGSKTPQGLYMKLEEMKKSGIQSSSITIPIVGWVGKSKGACN
ncbi:hypothetical protein [Terrimonas alba]|uniref:hypothetical protein n=1 Tax=Terrimonas alba TaxID=3349636 RepID=UPI0035F2B66D